MPIRRDDFYASIPDFGRVDVQHVGTEPQHGTIETGHLSTGISTFFSSVEFPNELKYVLKNNTI